MISLALQIRNSIIHASVEIIPRFIFGLSPGYFGKREQTRVKLVFSPFGCGDVFSPEIGLNTGDVFCFCGSEAGRYRIVTVDFFQRQVSTDCFCLINRFTLIEVEVAEGARCHDGIMTCPCSFYGAVFAPPRHDRGIGSQAALQNFIPADDFTTVFGYEFFNPPNEIALKFIDIFKFLVFQPFLAVGTGFPGLFIGFVTANMDVFRWKNVHYLR